jgi:hypothetical protein
MLQLIENNMSSLLPHELKEDFYIRIYFNIREGFEMAGIRRAYLDFNRTLPVLNKTQLEREHDRKNTEYYLKDKLIQFVNEDFIDFQAFDLYHRKLCEDLTGNWNELTIGQAQKWINMTLKYWLVFGERRIKNIEKNARFFHIPIDRLVQYKMIVIKGSKPWSKITDYDEYLKYQIQHRNKETGNHPIIDEFIFFNETNNK